MSRRNTDPISMSTALGNFVQKNKLDKGMNRVEVSKAWFALNPAFETYTTSLRFDRDTLFVNLSSSVFREELSYGKEKIRHRINEELGKDIVKKIVLR